MKVPPPLFVCFPNAQALIDALPATTREAHQGEILDLAARNLPPAVSLRTISTAFGISTGLVGAMAKATHRYYRIFEIRTGSKVRVIEAPRVALKLIQCWFGAHTARAIRMPDCVYGFVPGRNGVIEAAARHCGADWVYGLDLRDFFTSIKDQRVAKALAAIGYSEGSARFLTELLTLKGHLPQGSPASPVISNLVFQDCDAALSQIIEPWGLIYTRYADDLVFSGKGTPPPGMQELIKTCLSDHDWRIAEDKEYLSVSPARRKVHGLLVSGAKPRLTKGYRNRIRAFRHLIQLNGLDDTTQKRFRGHLGWAMQVESFAKGNIDAGDKGS